MKRAQTVPIGLVAAGVIAAVIGVFVQPARAWANLLIDGFGLAALGVSAGFFIATGRVTSARWSAPLRRIPEALMAVIPAGALMLVVLALGHASLYPWARPGGLLVAVGTGGMGGKDSYLSAPFVLARMVGVLAVWIVFGWHLRRVSLAQDRAPARALHHHERLERAGALFVVVFALSITLAAFDWLGSLDPSWSSTMFAVYVFAGSWVLGIAGVILGAIALADTPPLRGLVTASRLHDLGKLLFAFSIFWAYIWTCQYLLIWYGNIPEEVGHYVKRTNGPWLYVFAANFIVNWTVPFLGLLSANAKQQRRRLAMVATIVLAGRWLDLYLVVMPNLSPVPRFGVLEIAMAAGTAGLAILLFRRAVRRAPLVPLHDPVLAADHPELTRNVA